MQDAGRKGPVDLPGKLILFSELPVVCRKADLLSKLTAVSKGVNSLKNCHWHGNLFDH